VPLLSALVFIVLAGAIFGPALGIPIVSASLTTSAVACCLIARAVARRRGYRLEDLSPSAAKIDSALARGPQSTSLLLVLLLRLSPVVPFTFSNYLFGLTSVTPLVLGLGTLLGTLPTQAVYVAAGALGQKALVGELKMPPAILIGGTLATVGAVVLVGRVAQQTLAEMNVVEGASERSGAQNKRSA
jgi:uncharacterized membrane protein YdjX (TVP38/TMEM64 family)